MSTRIPIAEAERVARAHGLHQVLLIGYDGENTHVVTYGKDAANCKAAAQAQEFWTGKIREFSLKPENDIAATMAKVQQNEQEKHVRNFMERARNTMRAVKISLEEGDTDEAIKMIDDALGDTPKEEENNER